MPFFYKIQIKKRNDSLWFISQSIVDIYLLEVGSTFFSSQGMSLSQRNISNLFDGLTVWFSFFNLLCFFIMIIHSNFHANISMIFKNWLWVIWTSHKFKTRINFTEHRWYLLFRNADTCEFIQPIWITCVDVQVSHSVWMIYELNKYDSYTWNHFAYQNIGSVSTILLSKFYATHQNVDA